MMDHMMGGGMMGGMGLIGLLKPAHPRQPRLGLAGECILLELGEILAASSVTASATASRMRAFGTSGNSSAWSAATILERMMAAASALPMSSRKALSSRALSAMTPVVAHSARRSAAMVLSS